MVTIKQQIEADLKQSMLAGNKVLTETLRGLKGAILNVEVADNKRDVGLRDEEVVRVLQKEAKKRQESAELFEKGGNNEKAHAERTEKLVIDAYLPAQLSDPELDELIASSISELGASGSQSIGQVINLVKQRSNGQADGGRIAQAVKEKMNQ